MRYVEEVRKFVIERLLFGDEDHLDENTSFSAANIVDSTGVLELIMFLEETYKIKIADDELTPENLDSIANVASFLESKVDVRTGD